MKAFQNKNSILFLGTLVILLLPLLAAQFSNEVNWSPFDFLLATVLLLACGYSIQFMIHTFKNKKVRLLAISVVILVLILIWIELAVGVFGTPIAGN